MRRFQRSCIKAACAALACLLLLCALPCTALAALRHETVRVGFFAFDGYHMVDDDGNRSGYGYELLQHMVGYTDWQYEYVGYEKSWREMQDMLANGEIDLLTSAQKTDERLERFDFSDEPIGSSSAMLTVKAGSTEYLLQDYPNWSGMRIGLLEGSSRNADIAEFAAEKGFTYTPVYFDNSSELVDALQAGADIDAAVTSSLRAAENESTLAKFAPSPFYIMVKKGNTALLDQINQALEQLYCDHQNLQTELMEKYYTPKSGAEISFTAEERQFIDEMRGTSFSAFLNPDRVPLSYFEDGEATGIIGEIAAEISARTGLRIQIDSLDSREEYLSLLGAENADICFDFLHDFSAAERYGYHLTSPYIDAGISKLYLKSNTSRQKVGLVAGSYINNELGENLLAGYDELLYYDSTKALVEAIERGECDAGFLYTRVSERLVLDDHHNRLASEWVYGSNISFCVAVNADNDPRLFSILDKAAASLSDDYIDSIVRKYTTYEPATGSLVKFIYDEPLILSSFVGALLILAMLTAWMTRKRKLEAARLSEEQRQNARLSEALAAAKTASEAKSSFLSHMSNEMRTPLNAVIGFMELAGDAPPPLRNTYRENALTAARQLLSIINDVLDVAAIGAGKLKIASAPFNPQELIRHTAGIYAAQCAAKSLELQVMLETPVDELLLGDALRLNQLLMNLLSNAIKFTEHGFVRLSVRQQDAEGGGVLLRFVVSDSGCGMSEGMMSRMGMPFEQESVETARRYGGSGLGLYIVKTLTALMKGRFQAESAEGVGSAFTIELPFGRGEAQTQAQSEAPPTRVFPGRRVLLAEDNAMNRMVAEALIEKLGVVCETANDGNIALELFSASAPGYYDAVLMDIQMPNMDGYEATRAIRASAHPDAGSIAIIALSANAFSEDVEKALSAGMDDHVAKPIAVDKLAAALERAFEKNGK